MDPYPDPAIIGKAFVRQYYTQMHRDPNEMHKFYMSASSFVHGGSDMGSEEPVFGQKNIHEKILSLDLRQVHAKIKQVDSHFTIQKGIVVQVTGELSNQGHPMRAFVQTFVLAHKGEKKFYVYNDIFRYQDDDLVSESENETPGEVEPTHIDQPLESPDNFAPGVDQNAGVESGAGEGVYSETTKPGDASVSVPTVEEQQPTDMSTWNQYEPLSEVTQNGLDSSPQQQPPQEFPSATEPLEIRQDEETFQDSQEQDNKVGSTWASRLAGQKQQPPTNRPLNSTAIPTSNALPQREQRPRRTDNNRSQPHQQPLTSTAKEKRPDSCQIFVGGLPSNTSQAELQKVFEPFGTVTDVRVNPKNFAFVEFDNAKCVVDLLSGKESVEIRGKCLNIEEKRASRSGGGRGPGDRNRGSGVGGANKPRGGGGKPSKR